jgi:ankyrin repeat protein
MTAPTAPFVIRALSPAGAAGNARDGDIWAEWQATTTRGKVWVMIDNKGRTLLRYAAWHGHLGAVRWLAGHGGSATQPCNNGITPLFAAAVGGHLEVVQWLAGIGVSVTQPNNHGSTPLCIAAYRGHIEVVQWLAGHGGSVTQPNNDEWTPLYAAAREGHLEVVQWLARNGGSVTQPNNHGTPPLCIAAHNGHIEVVQWLAGHGGSVTQPNNSGITPLFAAALKGHLEVVQWLAGNGGSVTQPTNAGETAVAVAAANGHDRLAAFLTAAASWSGFQILVACRLADDTKRALRRGRLDPRAGPTSLAELVAASVSPKDALWAGSPDVCPATTRLVHDAMGHWKPSRHFLFHAGVRTHILVVTLTGTRVRGQHNVPAELWQLICSFFLRSDWEAPVA